MEYSSTLTRLPGFGHWPEMPNKFIPFLLLKVQLKMPWACEQLGGITGFTMETSADGPIQREKKIKSSK